MLLRVEVAISRSITMSSYSLLVVFALIFAKGTLAFYPYGGYLGAYPALGYNGVVDPYLGGYAYGHPYGLGYPRSALRNTAQSFHREDGHLLDTSILSPFKKNKRN